MHKYEVRYINLELSRSREYKRRIELIENRYINKGYHLTDALLRYYKRIKGFIACVEEALQELSPLHRQFYEMYYEEGKSLERVTITMRITQYTSEKLRKEIITKVAEKLGFIEE